MITPDSGKNELQIYRKTGMEWKTGWVYTKTRPRTVYSEGIYRGGNDEP